MSFEVVESKNLPLPLAKKLLRKRVDEGEVNELIRRVYEYLSKFSKCPEDKVEEFIEELRKFDLDERTIAMIISICPDTIEELRTLLTYEAKEFDMDALNEILEVVKKYKGSE